MSSGIMSYSHHPPRTVGSVQVMSLEPALHPLIDISWESLLQSAARVHLDASDIPPLVLVVGWGFSTVYMEALSRLFFGFGCYWFLLRAVLRHGSFDCGEFGLVVMVEVRWVTVKYADKYSCFATRGVSALHP
ncbi:hypothetical protein U1Q18_033324 [Sarracenia purpurea var. burkii]